jgi:hypothetical protein
MVRDQIRKFLSFLYPDPLVRGKDTYPDSRMTKQK